MTLLIVLQYIDIYIQFLILDIYDNTKIREKKTKFSSKIH